MIENLPQDIEVYEIVPVYQSVPKSDDLWPRYFRISLAIFFGCPARSLTNYFEESDESKIQLAIRVEIQALLPVNQRECLAGMIQHVPESHRALMVRHTEPPPRQAPDPESTCSRTRRY
jgi:hypothetical protein